MNLKQQAHTPSSPAVAIRPRDSLSAVTDRVADCIRNVLPLPVAIFVSGKQPRTYHTGDFTSKHLDQIRDHFESNPQSLLDLMRPERALADPYPFSDGSCTYFVPLAHNGALEAVLCLYDRSGREQELLQQHVNSIEPICKLTAMCIAGARGSDSDRTGRTAVASEVNPEAEENPQAMVRLVSSLLRTISHDIRTPITTVRGFVKMMLDGRTGPISDSQRESLRMAFQGIDQLIKIGTCISDASGHIEKIHAEIIDVPALWQSVVETSRPQLLAKSVTIEDTIDGDRRSVCGDRHYLTNLLERFLSYSIGALENHAKLSVNFRCRSDITLILTIPAAPGAPALPAADEELASAREIAFLHGGQITARQGKEGESILMLVLPGYNE